MRIRLLGPVSVTDGDVVVAVRGAKERALLALLAVNVGRVVSDDRLLDELWGDPLPANPANVLQKRVSELRKLIGPDHVVRRGDGYLLAVGADDVDAAVFERQVIEGRRALAAGDVAAASRTLGEALALWEGPTLAELADLPFARAEAARLDELRMSAVEDRVDAELALGRHAPIAGELSAFVAEHPLRERLRAQLMVALYRCGRQADALRAYQDGREVLAEELGLDPGPELRALEASILAQDPALAAPDSQPTLGNLPAPVTSFVGREVELAVIDDRLIRHRLVTLTGPGGVGKTRLALEVAGGRAGAMPGGVWLAELAPLVDGNAVPETLAKAVGARDAGNDAHAIPPTERVVAHVGPRPVVVVLDNCEHVLDAAAQLTGALLSACPNLRVLATSREPLGIAGEAQVPIPPLRPDEAEQLFVERAGAVNPTEASCIAGNPAVAQLCERLDGLPLAIELAAARVKTLPVEHIAARLDDRFRLLTGGSRTALARQQTLRATVEWSYDLLFEHERAVFCQLAVFAGGVDRGAAVAVCAGDGLDATDIEDTVGHLVDKSLLIREGDRYRMLETLRQFALARLADSGNDQAARAAHAHWCGNVVEDAVPGIRGAEQLIWLARLEVEHDNIRAAIDWALRADPVLALRLAAGVAYGWRITGHRQEARHLLELALLAAGPSAPPTLRSDGLTWAGYLAGATGWAGEPGHIEHELELARERQEQAVALAAAAGDRWRVATHQRYLAMTLVRQGAYGGAVSRQRVDAMLEGAAGVLGELEDDWGIGLTRIIQSYGALVAGDLEAGERAAEMARPHVGRCGDRYARVRMDECLAVAAELRGDKDAARELHEDALTVSQELRFEEAVVAHLTLLANLAGERTADSGAADERFGSDELSGAAAARNRLAAVALANGDVERAEALYREALAFYQRLGMAAGISTSETGLAKVAEARAQR